MEIIQASCHCSHIQFLQPFPNFHVPVRPSFAAKYYHPLPTSPSSLSLTLSIPRKPLTTTRSLLDDAISGSTTKVIEADADPFLAVKKKAMDLSPELKGTSIYLVGINSRMKSSLGKLLADALRYYFFDSDGLIAEAAGSEGTAKSFRERDEKGFRESETEVLKQLSSMGRLVVSAGNGSVQNTTNLALLRHGVTIWVDVPLDMVAKEVVEDEIHLSATEISTSRSYSEALTQLKVMYEEMKGGYATADATVSLKKIASQVGYDDSNAVTTEDMGLEVLKEIEKLIRVKKLMQEAARPF
ncbi:hypothetical protein RJ639_042203 [Escallonia herrerae]|uniref:Inactive shikimate kinase like 1, chloroplastic n=1 Tax=Escallonia herrerae TaxID=1293975 RepID=A0AA88WSI0_9ASTE|nr:hypothetical protein RJ639_042203 [Escallonia herrerae]